MKALILVDMEGASGITTDRLSWTRVHTEDWERFGRDRITADVAATARGALAGGAEAVTVMDMHDTGDSIRPEKLPAGARLVGLGDTLIPFGGIDSQHKILLMVGFHAKAVASLSDPGTAILPHTVHDPIADIRYNGRSLGEIGLFAGSFGALASRDSAGLAWGLLTGDKAACDEARDLSATVEVAAVKERLTDGSERLLDEAESATLIAERAEAAVRKAAEKTPLAFQGPIRLEVAFRRPEMTGFELPPYVDRADDRTVGLWAPDGFMALFLFYYLQPHYMPVVKRLKEGSRGLHHPS